MSRSIRRLTHEHVATEEAYGTKKKTVPEVLSSRAIQFSFTHRARQTPNTDDNFHLSSQKTVRPQKGLLIFFRKKTHSETKHVNRRGSHRKSYNNNSSKALKSSRTLRVKSKNLTNLWIFRSFLIVLHFSFVFHFFIFSLLVFSFFLFFFHQFCFFLDFSSSFFLFFHFSELSEQTPKPEQNRRTVPIVKMTISFFENFEFWASVDRIGYGPFDGDFAFMFSFFFSHSFHFLFFSSETRQHDTTKPPPPGTTKCTTTPAHAQRT